MTEQTFGKHAFGSRVTMGDVAQRAGVSRALVSIVMRGARGASEDTRQRVLQAAEELGYRPDVRARSLAGQRSRVLGVMLGVSVGVFPFEVLDGLFSAADAHGHHLIMAPLTKTRDEATAARALEGFRFDALIMMSPPTSTPLLAGRIPMAVIGWHVDHPGVDVIRYDDAYGIRAAVDHLVTLGHRDIAHLDGGDNVIAATRRSAYVSAMEHHGLSTYVRVVAGGQSQVEGVAGARQLCEVGTPPTAVIAYNDDTAVAAMGVFAQHGLALPDEMSVVGFDDADIGALSPVPLTTIAQQPDELGRLAVDRMIARIEQRRIPDREVVLEPRLVVRESTVSPVSRAGQRRSNR